MLSEWYWFPAPRKTRLESIFRSRDKFCFLVGSGISLDPPSSLPTGHQFMETLIERLIPQRELMNVLALTNRKREGMRCPDDFLRFEQLLEYLQRWYDPELRILDLYANCVTPNFNHLFLAEMILQGHSVFTTNFDSLIEYALVKAGVPQKQVYPIIYQEDWETRPQRKQWRVYKLHGSLMDLYNKQRCPETIETTLAPIAQCKGEIFQLEYWKRQVLDSFLQNYDLVVLGYSGLNDFDIMPSLWNIHSTKRIIWISHDPERVLNQALVERLTNNKSLEDPFSVSQSDRIGQNLLSFARYNTRHPLRLIHITVNTGQLIEWLWTQYIRRRPTIISSTPTIPVKVEINNLLLSESARWGLTGRIFEDHNLHSKSLRAYHAALHLTRLSREQRRQATCLTNIGRVFQKEKRLDDALNFYQQVLNIYNQLGELRGRASALNDINTIFRIQGRLNEALEQCHSVLNIYEQLGDIEEKATTLITIGSIFFDQNRLEEAIRYYQGALDIHENLGNRKEQISVLIKIGNAFFRQERLDQALKSWLRVLAITEELGDLRGKGEILDIIGALSYQKKDLKEALKCWEEVPRIADQLGDLRWKADSLSTIGVLLHSQARFDDALEFLRQSLLVSEERGDLREKAISLNNIGRVLYDKKRLNEALKAYQEAFIIARKLNDKALQEVTLQSLAHIQSQL
ncbi:MAG: tetratricopeptide repeat protein [Candidatus Hermodarchaeota archaeon]